ncbi:MAG: hypothetical protein IJ646_01880 [Clostridia bacterium]|nr:hypothetical protein [Clostridia bacterium]
MTETVREALGALFAACLVTAAADALFDGGADGLRLTCGLAVALCAARLAAGAMGLL